MSTSYTVVAATEKDDKNEVPVASDVQVVDVEAQSVQIESKKDEKVHNEYKTTPNDLDPGLTANVIGLSETPKQLLARMLGENEEVIATFDVKFPGEFMPLWMIVTLCIITCGLYGFILFFRWIRRCCYRWKCCTPDVVTFAFGKMAVTSKGRVICWEEVVYQKKKKDEKSCLRRIISYILCGLDAIICPILWFPFKICANMCCRELCQAPVDYAFVNFVRVYTTKDIKQLTQYYTSEALCLFCCLDYSCGIEVSFNSYDHGNNHLQIASRSWFSDDEFGNPGQAAANTYPLGTYWSTMRALYGVAYDVIDTLESGLGGTSNLNRLYILGNTGDRVHNGDVDSLLRDLALLHKKVLDCMPVFPDAIIPSHIDEKGIKLDCDGALGFSSTSTSNKKVEFTDWFKLVQVVKNDGTVQLPKDWVPMLNNEEIIAVSGQVRSLTCWEWFMSIISCGINYCCKYRRRKYTRSAIVLTNKRLITMDLYERSGSIPATLSNFSVQVRSYVLEKVISGYIRSTDPNSLEAGIETPSGLISIFFLGTGRKAMAFAQAMQMSVARRQSKVDLLKYKQPAEYFTKDKSTDFALLPLLGEEETLIDWMRGEKIWERFGQTQPDGLTNYLRQSLSYWGGRCLGCDGLICDCPDVGHCCSPECLDKNTLCMMKGNELMSTCCLWPCLPYVLTCALRPFQTREDIIVTDMTMMRFVRTQNWGICGCLRFCGLMSRGFCTSQDNFTISWEPIESFSGFNILIHGAGSENVIRRCCAGNCIGKECCPIGWSKAEVRVDFKGKYAYSARRGGEGGSSSHGNKNWLNDEELARDTKLLTAVQFAINAKVEETNGSMSADPKKKRGLLG